MVQRKVLIVEDDPTLLEVLKYNLEKEEYAVVTADDGLKGLDAARSSQPDFIILDLMLPKMSGFEVCRILRQKMSVPILMLTAKEDEIDKIVGLDLGADDYMTKPFKTRELLSRIRAIFRRTDLTFKSDDNGALKVNDLEIDVSRHRVLRKGVVLDLTPKEFELLTFLAKRLGETGHKHYHQGIMHRIKIDGCYVTVEGSPDFFPCDWMFANNSLGRYLVVDCQIAA